MANDTFDVFSVPPDQQDAHFDPFNSDEALKIADKVREDMLRQSKSSSSFHAAETYELTSFEKDHATQMGRAFGPEDARRALEANKQRVEGFNGEVNTHPAKEMQFDANENKVVSEFKQTAEQTLNNVTDPTAAAQKLKEEAVKVKEIVQTAKKAGIYSVNNFFDEAKTAKMNTQERQAYMMAFDSLQLLQQGYDPSAVQNHIGKKYRTPDFIKAERAKIEGKIVDGGNTEPLMSPEMFIVDVIMGPAAIAIDPLKKAAFTAAWKAGSKAVVLNLLGKETLKSVTFGALAGGFMTAADLAGAGKAVQITSGVIGPMATYGLITASRRGLVNALGAIWAGKNKPLVEQLEKSLKGQGDAFSKTVLEAMAEIRKNGVKDAKIKVKPPRSAGARIADGAKEVGDKRATESLVEMAKQTASLETDTPIKQTIAEVVGTGPASPFNPVALTLDAEGLALKAEAEDVGEEVAKKLGLWEAGRTEKGKFASKSRGDSQNVGNMLDAKTNGFPKNTKNMTDELESAFNGNIDVAGDSTTITTRQTPWVERSPVRIMDTMTDLADNLNNANAIAEQIVPPIMFEEVTKRQAYVNNIIHQRMYKRETDFGTTNLGWKGKNIRGVLSQLFWTPEYSLKDLADDLVIKPTVNEYEANRLAKAGKDALKGIFKGLKDKEREDLISVLEMGNDFEEVFTVAKGGLKDSKGNFFEASPSTVDAYFASRNLFDHYHNLANNTAVRQARAKGFQLLENEFLVEVRKSAKLGDELVDTSGATVKWTKANKEAGDVVVHTQDAKGNPQKMILTSEEASKMLQEIPDNHRMIGYRKGYLPIIYKDPYAITMVKDEGKEGLKSYRVATAKNFREAEKAVARLKAQDPDAHFVAHRKHEDAVDTVYDTTFAQTLHDMTPGELEAIKKTLREAGVEEEVLDAFESGTMSFSHKRNSFFKERGSERLKSADTVNINDVTGRVEGRKAPYVPTEQAIAKYINAISKYTSHTEWNTKLQAAFVEKYGEVLENPNSWNSGIKIQDAFKSTEKAKLAYEAFVVKDQLERVFGIRSFTDMALESYKHHAVASLYKKGPIASLAAQGIDNLPNFFKVVNLLKSVGAVSKLGLYNVSQLVVQSTATLNVVGKHLLTNPKVIGEGMTDFMQAIVPMAFKVAPDAEASRLHELLNRSGFLAGFDYTELQRIATNVESWSAMGIRRKVGGVLEAGESFWKAGEGIVRGTTWFTERRALISEVKSGKNTLFSLKDIDSDKFLDAVSERAMVTALNMTRFNQALISRGIIGVPGQFKQFAIQQLHAMTNKDKLTYPEIAGMWAAWTGLFGLSGVPIFMDAIVFGEDMAGEKHPEAIGGFRRWEFQMADHLSTLTAKAGFDKEAAFFQRWLDKGPTKALTDGQIDLANRSTVGMIFNHFQDAQPYADWGPSISIIHKTLTGGVKGVTDLYNAFIEGEANPSSVLADLTQVVGEAAGVANPIIAGRAAIEGPLRGKDGKITINDPTLSELAQQAAGITPGRVVDMRDRNFVSYRVVKAWKDWGKTAQGRILEAYNGNNPNYAVKLFDQYLIQAATYNPKLASKFQKATMMNLMQAGVSKEYKSEMMAVNNSYAFDDEELREILVGGQ